MDFASAPKRVLAAIAATLALLALVAVLSNSSSSLKSSSSPMTQATLFDHLRATTTLFWGQGSSQKFFGIEYQAQTATQKLSQLWSAITKDTKSSNFNPLKLAAIFLEDLSTTFTWKADTLPEGHVKSIHSVGNVAQAEWVSSGGHPFTGVFKGWKQVLIRLSSAVAPTATSVAPGIGVKFLRDGKPSSNFVAMFSVDGQENMNFFANNWVNHIPAPVASAPATLGKKFATKQGGTYGFIQQVGLKDCAAPGKVYPYSLEFRPTDAVRNKYSKDTKTSFLDQLSSIASGTTLFEIFAKAGPNSDNKKIGSLKTTSAMVTSKFGDDKLFFQHRYMLDDIKSACDSGLPDCKCWLKETEVNTGPTAPFGPPPPPLPSGIPSGCPLRL